MRKFAVLAITFWLCHGSVAQTKVAGEGILKPETRREVQMIPRAALFGNPERSAAQLSPDGRLIAYLAPDAGVMNIWVAPIKDIAAAKPVTRERKRPVPFFLWSPDGAALLYLKDEAGEERHRLYAADPAGGGVRSLSPETKAMTRIIAISPDRSDAILIGLNDRDPRWHDVYRLSLKTGAIDLVFRNEGYSGFLADRDLRLRLAVKPLDDGGQRIDRLEDGIPAGTLLTISHEDEETTGVISLLPNGKTAHILSSLGRDKAALYAFDLVTGGRRLLAESDKADIDGWLLAPKTGALQAYRVNDLTGEWFALGESLVEDIRFLNDRLGRNWQVSGRTENDRLWTVQVNDPLDPGTFWLYERQERKLERLFHARPALAKARLAPMLALEIKARDGKRLASYLTLPLGSDKDGNGRPDKPLPMVVNVHGGPWGRDHYGYHGEHQWLANRGYAVLSVNFRGSTGFGKAFLNAGNLEWGRGMHNDVMDAVAWAKAEGIANKSRIAIYGGSYGGYQTLWALATAPETFACGVDIFGPSDLNTLLSSVPAHWAGFYESLTRRVGDPRTEAGRALLAARSPLNHAEAIVKPLLIAQGANDIRVKETESSRIVEVLQRRNVPVTYALYPDEGHGFARTANTASFYAIAESFLSQCLGGSAEPIGGALKGSSVEVKAGAEAIPGLSQALLTPASVRR
jgi:dipeptidyl aminopeptidase/acylaminoacyl peptidase